MLRFIQSSFAFLQPTVTAAVIRSWHDERKISITVVPIGLDLDDAVDVVAQWDAVRKEYDRYMSEQRLIQAELDQFRIDIEGLRSDPSEASRIQEGEDAIDGMASRLDEVSKTLVELQSRLVVLSCYAITELSSTGGQSSVGIN